MNDVTYRFKNITTMKFFNLTIKYTTSDSCLFKKKMSLKPSIYALFLRVGGRRKNSFLSCLLCLDTFFCGSSAVLCVGTKQLCQ